MDNFEDHEISFPFTDFVGFPENNSLKHCRSVSTGHPPTTKTQQSWRRTEKSIKADHHKTASSTKDLTDEFGKETGITCNFEQAFDTLFPQELNPPTLQSNPLTTISTCKSTMHENRHQVEDPSVEWWNFSSLPPSEYPVDSPAEISFKLNSEMTSFTTNQEGFPDFELPINPFSLETEQHQFSVPDSHRLSATVSNSFDSSDSKMWQAGKDAFSVSSTIKSIGERSPEYKNKNEMVLTAWPPISHDTKCATGGSRCHVFSRIKAKSIDDLNAAPQTEKSPFETLNESKLASAFIQAKKENDQLLEILNWNDLDKSDGFRSTLADSQIFIEDYHRLLPAVSGSFDSSDDDTEKTDKTSSQDFSTSESGESEKVVNISVVEARIGSWQQSSDIHSVKSCGESSVDCNSCSSPALSEKTSEHLNCVLYHRFRESRSSSTVRQMELKQEWISIPDNIFIELKTSNNRDHGKNDGISEVSDGDTTTQLRNSRSTSQSASLIKKKSINEMQILPCNTNVRRVDSLKPVLQPSSHDTVAVDSRRSRINSIRRRNSISEATKGTFDDSFHDSQLACAYLLAKKENEQMQGRPTSDGHDNNNDPEFFRSTIMDNFTTLQSPEEDMFEI